MVVLPVWFLIFLCLPYVVLSVLFVITGIAALCDSREAYKAELRAKFEAELSPLERAFRSGEEAIERGNRIYFEGKEIEQIEELLVLAMEEMMSINSKDRFQNFLGEEERKYLHEMMDADAVFLKRARHLNIVEEIKTDADN